MWWMRKVLILAILIADVVIVAVSETMALDPRFCGGYAKSAVNQQKKNIRLRCGFSGPRWSFNFNHHRDWCLRLRDSRHTLSERKIRSRSLSACETCSHYARNAIRQVKLNRRLRCGFRGPRWSFDYNGHFSWCYNNKKVRVLALWYREQKARSRQLNGCRRALGR